MPLSLELDLEFVGRELLDENFINSSTYLKSAKDIFGGREHGYRHIDDFTLLHAMDFQVLEPYSLTMHRTDLVCVQILLAGSYSRWAGGRPSMVSSAMLEISNYPSTVAEGQVGRGVRGVLIVCDRKHFIAHYAPTAQQIPEQFRPIFYSRLGMPRPMKLSMPHTVIVLTDQILNCRYPEPLRSVYIKAKVQEILCVVAFQLRRFCPQQRIEQATGLGLTSKIRAAAEIYRLEMSRPPTTTQLASRVGLNRDDLNGGFKELFGVTPHAFSRDLRMKLAKELLDDGGLSLTAVALRVGYGGYASFTRAYQEHYGVNPAAKSSG